MSYNSSLSSLASLDDLLRILRDKISILEQYPNYQLMLKNEFWRARSTIELANITADILTSPFLLQQAISSALQAVQTAMLEDRHIDIRNIETGKLVHGLYTADTSKLLESFANMTIYSADASSSVTKPSLPVKKEFGPKRSVTKQRQDTVTKVTTLTDAQHVQLAAELKALYEDNTFQYYPFGQRRCVKEGCELCRKVFCYAPLSNCSLHGGLKCTRLGWYPHLPPQIQAHKVKEHRMGSVTIWQPPLQPGQIENPLPGILFPTSSGASTPTPYQPHSPEGTPPPQDKVLGSPSRLLVQAQKRASSRESSSASWADESEQIVGAKAPRVEVSTSP